MIEVFRRFNSDELKLIKIVCYQHDDKETLFPQNQFNVEFIKVPGNKLSPFLLKMFWFHLYTFFMRNNFKDTKQISIGLASFNGEFINIQFIHQMWSKLYFKTQNFSLVKFIYKKILFSYFNIAESFYYKSSKLKFISLSQFMSDYLENNFNVPPHKLTTAYSSVDTKRFQIPEDRTIVLNKLQRNYPQLQRLNLSKPVYLFVGAFERKGLKDAIEYLNRLSSPSQFIVVGKPEKSSSIDLNAYENIIHIPFSKEIESFYQISDVFLFPTLYEPFGLVLTEAASSGLIIISRENQVGAMEILSPLNGVYSLQDKFYLEKPLTNDDKKQFRDERLKVLEEYSWENCSQAWWNRLKEIS